VQAILSLPFVAYLAVLFAFALICLGLGLLVIRGIRTYSPNVTEQVPIAAFLGMVSTAWALSLGFAASDIWALNARADHVALSERSAITRLMGVSEPGALDLPEIYQSAKDYAHAAMQLEWIDGHNRAANPTVDKAVQSIRLAIIQMTRDGANSALIAKIVRDFDELQDARNERLAIGQSVVDETKWYLVISLTILATINIALTHAAVPKAGRNALMLFSVVVFVSLAILGLHSDPFLGVKLQLSSSIIGETPI